MYSLNTQRIAVPLQVRFSLLNCHKILKISMAASFLRGHMHVQFGFNERLLLHMKDHKFLWTTITLFAPDMYTVIY